MPPARDRFRRVPANAAIRVEPFTFDRTLPIERACAEYIKRAPAGQRTARMRRLILEGFATRTAARQDASSSTDANEG